MSPENIQDTFDMKSSLQKFNIIDCISFVAMLLTCGVIGIYFGFIRRRGNYGDAEEYILGGRTLNTLPVGLSLAATYISGISLLGSPTEIYVYGTQYVFIIISIILMGFVTSAIYLPVFHDLKITSTYEYLEKRFDKKTRVFASVLYVSSNIIWLPMVIYIPALAFNQVTGTNVHITAQVLGIVCIFYTCFGGIRAVVWTDLVQAFIMIGAIALVAIKGTFDVGGLSVVWNRSMDSGRIEAPDLKFDFKTRYTVWSVFIGGFVYFLQFSAIKQHMVQRYMSLPSLKHARRAMWIFVFTISFILGISFYIGLLIYSHYHDCDPLTTKLAEARDQLLPLFVMTTFENLPGLTGIFTAGLFSATLSSLSTGLNSMAAVVLEDFYKGINKKELSERATGYVMRGSVAFLGVLCIALVYLVEKLGSLLQLTMSFGSVTDAPLLGLFSMGMLLPWVNSRGALAGGISGLIFTTWICMHAQVDIMSGVLSYTTKNFTTEGCNYNFTASVQKNNSMTSNTGFSLHHVSYLWYTLLGTGTTMIVGVIVSFFTGANKPEDIPIALLSPPIRKLIKKRRCGEERYVRNALMPLEVK